MHFYNISILTKAKLIAVALAICSFLIFLAILDLKTFNAFMITSIILTPVAIISFYLSSLSIKLFVGIATVTQLVGIISFFLNRTTYEFSGWRGVKYFSFTNSEIFQIYSIFGIILLLIICFHFIFIALSNQFKIVPHQIFPEKNRLQFFLNKKNGSIFSLILLFFIIALVPLHFWMFKNGIALTGIQPPLLPYKLSGVLYYATRFIFPAIIFYLYARSSRTLLLSLALLFYSTLLGFSQVSRFSLFFSSFPILFFHFIEKKKVLTLFFALWIFSSFQLIGLMRNVLYKTDYVTNTISQSSNSLISLVKDLFNTQSSKFSLVESIPEIMGRIESPQNIILAYQFKSKAIGGSLELVQNLISEKLNPLDKNSFNFEWMHYQLPADFATGSGFLCRLMIVAHESNIGFIFLCLLIAFILFLGEVWATKISHYYQSESLKLIVLFLFTGLILVGFGTSIFWIGFFLFFTVSFISQYKLVFFKKRNQVNAKKGEIF